MMTGTVLALQLYGKLGIFYAQVAWECRFRSVKVRCLADM